MYCGHIGIGLAAKGIRPRLPLWAVLIAAFGADWLETVLIAAGFSGTALLSHSLPSVAIGAILTGLLVSVWRRSPADGLYLAGVYASHLVVDYITGFKPVGFGHRYFGLHLYRIPVADFALESALILGGWLLYRQSFAGKGTRNSIVLYGLLFSLIAVQALFDRFFAGG
jgi:hypothetical protein